MAPKATVAILNKVGKKNASLQPDRFKARVSDVFSPDKIQQTQPNKAEARRSSLRLQQRSELQPSTIRRDLYDFPGNEVDLRPVPKPKRKIALSKDREHGIQSPLKKQGFNMQLKDNPNVYLADSPAKHTRSKDHNPLKAVLQVKVPELKSSSHSNQWKQTPAETKHKTNLPTTPTPTKSSPRKRQSGVRTAHEDQDEELTRSAKRARKEADNDQHLEQNEHPNLEDQGQDQSPGSSEAEANESVTEESESEQEAEQEAEQPVEASGEHPKRHGRPRKKAVIEDEQQDKQIQESLPQQARLDATIEAQQAEFDKYKALYTKKIEDAIKINSCEDSWSSLGAAAHMIKKRSVNGRELTGQGRSFVSSARRLIECYNDLLKPNNTQPETEQKVVKYLGELEHHCEFLKQPSHKTQSLAIINDMYLYIIPAMVLLLKPFLRCRFQGSAPEAPALRELMCLLNVSVKVCTKALSWQPRPETLKNGIKKWVRNDISPNLKRIQGSFSSDVWQHDRKERDLVNRQKLNKNMANSQQSLRDRCERAKSMRKLLRERRGPLFMYVPVENKTDKTVAKHVAIARRIHDIDEINDHADIQPSQDDGPPDSSLSLMQEAAKAGPRLLREPTVEIPPPLRVNLSEEEKMALLNGLQMYTDKSRFSKILDDPQLGSILKQRDLDDLMEAARSFSQMMASKMGMEAYRSDRSLWWLRSTDPAASTGITNDV